jgi:hypothetical protein
MLHGSSGFRWMHGNFVFGTYLAKLALYAWMLYTSLSYNSDEPKRVSSLPIALC